MGPLEKTNTLQNMIFILRNKLKEIEYNQKLTGTRKKYQYFLLLPILP